MSFRYDWLPQESWVYLGPAFHARPSHEGPGGAAFVVSAGVL